MFTLAKKTIISLLFLITNFSPLLSQPPNDEISTALDIIDIPFSDVSVDFSQADSEGPVPASDGTCFDNRAMIWYKFTFDLGADIIISVSAGLSNIILYTSPDESATDFTNLVPLQSCSNRDTLYYVTIPNQTYYILIANTSVTATISVTGSYIPPPNPPLNDEISTALEIVDFTFIDTLVNFPDADTEGPVPASDGPCYHYEPMVWYKFTTSSNGSISAISGSGSYIVVVFYTASNQNAQTFDDLTPVSTCRGSVDGVGIDVIANQTYYVVVASMIATDIIFTSDIALPVELDQFSATVHENDIVLDWRTLTETNNLGFEIERLHVEEWQSLGFVAGEIESNLLRDYSFIDDSPIAGWNYYRLKQIDISNEYSYSNIIGVKFKYNNLIRIYPNPFINEIWIETDLNTTQCYIEVFNVHGKSVYSQYLDDINDGIRLSSLSKGVYTINIITAVDEYSQLLIKK